jgi:hypothetical protein
MQHIEPGSATRRTAKAKSYLLATAGFLFCVAGCGSNSSKTADSTGTQNNPQTYVAPYVFNTTNGGPELLLQGPYIYQIDDTLHTFSQSTFTLGAHQKGPQTINTGGTSAGKRGLLALGLTANYTVVNSVFVATTTGLTQTNGFAFEIANRAGGLAQIPGQPAVPLVASQCPVLKAIQTYQFVTIPGPLIDSSKNAAQAPFWDSAKNTAYGSVDITSDGTNVNFANIHQYTLPSGAGTPVNPATSSIAGLCGPTALGNTISVPGELTTTNPGQGSVTMPQAAVAIGPTGMLIEDNGAIPSGSNVGAYQDVLGDGSGAVGLPKPSSPVDVGSLRSAQYLGFVNGAGAFSAATGGYTAPGAGWSTHLVSFGFAAMPSNCPVANSSTALYGGDFTQNGAGVDDPASFADGFGNCDLAIDLGTQDPANNGLFPNAVVWLGSAYAANTTGKTYSFKAVAIAGQLNGKNAIFIIGADTTEPWSIYLMQSN